MNENITFTPQHAWPKHIIILRYINWVLIFFKSNFSVTRPTALLLRLCSIIYAVVYYNIILFHLFRRLQYVKIPTRAHLCICIRTGSNTQRILPWAFYSWMNGVVHTLAYYINTIILKYFINVRLAFSI